jgi:hypothetical protein
MQEMQIPLDMGIRRYDKNHRDATYLISEFRYFGKAFLM